MKHKRIALFSTLVGMMIVSIGIAFAAGDTKVKQMEIGYMTISGSMYVYYDSGILYDDVRAKFFFQDHDTAEEDAAMLGSKLVIEVKKYRNDAVLDTKCYTNNNPKPCSSLGTRYSYSDNWVYRANGTKLIVKTQKDPTSSSYEQYEHYIR